MLLSEAINEATRFMRRRRPEVTEQTLIVACSQCGRSFEANRLSVIRTTRKLVYRCPVDEIDLVRVGVGAIGSGGADIEIDCADSVGVKFGTEDVAELLGEPARAAGLVPAMHKVNVGCFEDDFRIPDGALHREIPRALWFPTLIGP